MRFYEHKIILAGLIIFIVFSLASCSHLGGLPGDSGDEEYILDDLKAISGSELEASFENGETVNVTNFSPKPLPLGEETEVSFRYEGSNYKESVTHVINVQGSLDTNQENMNTANINTSSNLEAAKVVLLYSNDYEIFEVNDGKFNVDIDREEPGGIAFVDEDNNYIGYLALEDGLDSFPTQAISEETGEIDLGEINFDKDGMGTPEKKPFEGLLNDKETDILKTSQSFFGAALRSPKLIKLIVSEKDLNFNISLAYNINNIPKFEREGNKITYENCFGKEHDEYEGETYPLIGGHRLGLSINLGIEPEKVYIEYPNLEENVEPRYEHSETNFYSFVGVGLKGEMDPESPEGSPIPKAGKYKFVLGEKKLELYIPDLSEPTAENLVFATPTFHLEENEEGIELIEKITWRFRDRKGNIIENPENIISEMEKNVSLHIGFQVENKEGYYEDAKVAIDEDEYVLEKDIGWDKEAEKIFRNVNMSYEDIYGLEYTVPFSKFN